jgi:hypothetical protein
MKYAEFVARNHDELWDSYHYAIAEYIRTADMTLTDPVSGSVNIMKHISVFLRFLGALPLSLEQCPEIQIWKVRCFMFFNIFIIMVLWTCQWLHAQARFRRKTSLSLSFAHTFAPSRRTLSLPCLQPVLCKISIHALRSNNHDTPMRKRLTAMFRAVAAIEPS